MTKKAEFPAKRAAAPSGRFARTDRDRHQFTRLALVAAVLGVALASALIVWLLDWMPSGRSGPAWMDLSGTTNLDVRIRVLPDVPGH